MKDFSEVRALVGGLKGVIQKVGDAPANDNWKHFPECPFCKNKKCAGVFNKGEVDLFKCQHNPCFSQNEVLTEVSYVALKFGLDDKKPHTGGPSEAYKRLLELAGCYEEFRPKPAPSPRPAAAEPAPAEPPTDPIRANPLSLPNPVIPQAPVEPPSTPVSDAEMLQNCIEVIRVEQKASVRLFRRHLGIGDGRASRMLDELEKMGIVGSASGAKNDPTPREILKLPDRPPGISVVKLDDKIYIERAPVVPVTPLASPSEKGFQPEKPEDANSKLPLGLALLRKFFSKLTPTEDQMAAYLEDGRVPEPIPAAVAKNLKFKPVPMFFKRGLTTVSCEALGFRANPTTNEALLQELRQEFSWEEMRASGLWLDMDRKSKLGRRPNAQFHGKGQIGRKPEKERKNKDDKWVWGFCEPVLIPYFDEGGELIKLRPHKGGAPGGTIAGRSRIYVPRDYRHCADTVEKFYEVVICEGEFKAAAIWQTLGLGAKLQVAAPDPNQKSLTGEPIPPRPLLDDPHFEPIGVCALPGISYVQNAEMRLDLERWLVDVGARRVYVAFDDEDKSDKPMHQRFDAQIAARVLAISLSKLLHLVARVCVLPREWRNEKGKADWDGALAAYMQGKL